MCKERAQSDLNWSLNQKFVYWQFCSEYIKYVQTSFANIRISPFAEIPTNVSLKYGFRIAWLQGEWKLFSHNVSSRQFQKIRFMFNRFASDGFAACRPKKR